MASKSISPIKTWIFWSILVIVAFLLITWDHFVQGFTQDSSKITWLIMGFFLYGFGTSFMVALKLQAEFNSIRRMEEDHRVGDANASDIAALFDSAMERIRRGDRIDVRTLVSAYGGKVRARVDNVGVISGMLITIGLLGTVVGLIITISGLDMVLQSNSADFATMKAGLTKTVSGMGTAFYTTFFGALLGGVVLKVLGSEMRKSAQTLVADALAFGELFISPQFAKKSSESLTELEERISVLHEQLASLGSSFGEVIETIDSKQTTLASGLGSLNEIIEKTSQQATER
ncbi:MAG: MotA/TolQ/ExbB proton channel family protein, partial [Pontiella sp.]|nr:MotA/TolQ/ExbB proton channel family protein [Pontiella sp.]